MRSEKSKLWQTARRETRRLERLLERVPEDRRTALKPACADIGWMRAHLNKAREEIGEESLTVEYDNGGGQSGIRENPAFRAYESLWKAYMAGMDRILAALPEEDAEKEKAAQAENVLDILMAKKRAQS